MPHKTYNMGNYSIIHVVGILPKSLHTNVFILKPLPYFLPYLTLLIQNAFYYQERQYLSD